MSTIAVTNANIFETASRKLEQFLYMHDIRHRSFHKNADGMTVWVYSRTPELTRVVEEFREIVSRRERSK